MNIAIFKQKRDFNKTYCKTATRIKILSVFKSMKSNRLLKPIQNKLQKPMKNEHSSQYEKAIFYEKVKTWKTNRPQVDHNSDFLIFPTKTHHSGSANLRQIVFRPPNDLKETPPRGQKTVEILG